MFLKKTASGDVNTELNKVINEFFFEAAKKYDEMDYFNKQVQFQEDGNDAANASVSFLLAGPPKWAPNKIAANGFNLDEIYTPLGGIQGFNPQESRNVIPVPEQGSALNRVIPGGTQYGLNLSRLHTRHSDLKYALYSYVFTMANKLNGGKIVMNRPPGPNYAPGDNTTYSRKLSGLEGELYGIPFGILSVNMDSAQNLIGVDSIEGCKLMGYGSSRQAGGVAVFDSVNLFVNRIVPVFLSNSFDTAYTDSTNNKTGMLNLSQHLSLTEYTNTRISSGSDI